MRLNPDCIRDILFFVEENTGYNSWIDISRNIKKFNITLKNHYPPDEILYHIELCEEYGYLNSCSDSFYYFQIRRLSVVGHEFLENIRNNNNWNKTKDISLKIGSVSLNTLSQIASNVISDLIISTKS